MTRDTDDKGNRDSEKRTRGGKSGQPEDRDRGRPQDEGRREKEQSTDSGRFVPLETEQDETTHREWIREVEGIADLTTGDAQVSLGADGTTIGVADHSEFSIYRLGGDGASGKVHGTTDYGERITAVEPLPDGRLVVVTSGDEPEVTLADESRTRTLLTLEQPPQSIAVGGSRVFLAMEGDESGAPKLLSIDVRSGAIDRSIPLAAGPITLTASPSGRYMTVANQRTKLVRTIRTEDECEGADGGGHADRCEKGVDGEPSDDGSVVVVKPDGTATEKPGEDHDPEEPNCTVRLDWPIARLATAGNFLIATDAERRNLAVLNPRGLSVLAEVTAGEAGRTVALNQNISGLLSFDHYWKRWEYLDLEELARTLPPIVFDTGAGGDTSGDDGDSMTFFGQREFSLSLGHAPSNDTTRVLAVPMIEAGQTFSDPDLTKFGTFMQREAWQQVREYYDEATFGVLDMQIDLFGDDAGPAGTPVQLPDTFRTYFWPDYTPGGLKAVHTFPSVPTTVRLDGTEMASIRVIPRARSPETLSIPFCALGTTAEYDTFPIDIDFDGTETAQLDVETQDGTAHTLDLTFDAQSFTITQGNVESDIAALATYINGVIDDAETAAGVPAGEELLESVAIRRVRKDGVEFGDLELNFSLTAASGSDKGRVELASQSGLESIGFDDTVEGVFEFGSVGADFHLEQYLSRALRLAETDADIDFTNRYLEDADVSFDSAASELFITFRLSSDDGGPGASIELQSHTGLDALGFSGAMPVPGSESNANNQNTMRHIRRLADHVYTELVARLGGGDQSAFFQQYNAILLSFVGAPDATVPMSEQWGASAPDLGGLRMFLRGTTATNAADTDDTLQATWIGSILDATPNNATTAHELGHVLRFPDLYASSSHRDDLLYMGGWAMMNSHWNFPHFCGYHKLQAGWIEDGPEARDDNGVRVLHVPRPVPDETTTVEALLVPVEYWDSGMKTAVRAAFGGSVPIVQLMKINLGGDGVQFGLVEARQQGVQFSQSLPSEPAVLLSNAIEPDDDTRYAQRGRYRRKVHRLNTGADLDTVGEEFDLASAPELAAKGVTATVVDKMDVTRPTGLVTVFHVRIEREPADYVDLAFTETTPNWKSPDVYVDWVGDNVSDDPDDHRVYPVGTPLGQGEAVRYPSSGTEPHWIVGRVWNNGTVQAENVELNYYVCDPPGSGDSGNFKLRRTKTADEVAAGGHETVPGGWDINPSTNSHSCLRIEIGDWELPDDPVDAVALASDDLWLSNNWAQQNVNEFIPLSGSPYEPINFQYSVANDGLEPERVRLEPDGLSEGMKLTVTPSVRMVQPDEVAIFDCTLELDHQVIDTGCKGDREFLVVAWRETPHDQERWGAVHYTVRPREATEISLKGHWTGDSVIFYGTVTPAPPVGERVLLRLAFAYGDTRWHATTIKSGGTFRTEVDATDEDLSKSVETYARYEGNQILGPSNSDVVHIYREVLN